MCGGLGVPSEGCGCVPRHDLSRSGPHSRRGGMGVSTWEFAWDCRPAGPRHTTRPPGRRKPSRREPFPWPGVLEVPLPEEPGAAPGPQPAGSRPLTASSSRRPQSGLLPWAAAGRRRRAGLQQHLLLVCRPRPGWEPGPRVRGSGEWTSGGARGGGGRYLAGRSQGAGLSCAWAPRAPPSTCRLQGQTCKRAAGVFGVCCRTRARVGRKMR